MRKENFLIGMMNRGVLALNVPIWPLRRRFMMTKTLEWNLHWCILECMFDEHFKVRPDFVNDPDALRRRFRSVLLLGL